MPATDPRTPHLALVSLGSNIEPERWMPVALRLIAQRFDGLEASPSFVTPPVGGAAGQAPYANAACAFRTDLHPRSLRAVMRMLETRCGRVRVDDRCAPRTMDLDLVWLRDEAGQTLLLDPALTRDAHVLVPAAELWPGQVLPGSAATLAERAAALDASTRAGIRLLEEPFA